MTSHRIATTFIEGFLMGRLAERIIIGGKTDPAALALFDEWLARADMSVWERNDLRQMGVPDRIETHPQTTLPAAHWDNPASELIASTRPPEGVQDRLGGYIPTRIFQPKSLTDFPERSKSVRVSEPMHVAQACLVELLRGQLTDVQHLIAGVKESVGIQRLGALIEWYQTTARVCLERIPEDAYLDWSPEAPAAVPYSRIPAVVERRAATMLCQRALTMHLCAKAFAADLTRIEEVSARRGRDPGKAFVEHLTQMLESSNDLLQALNRNLAHQHGGVDANHDLHFVHRLLPGERPGLVIAPTGSGTNTTPMS